MADATTATLDRVKDWCGKGLNSQCSIFRGKTAFGNMKESVITLAHSSISQMQTYDLTELEQQAQNMLARQRRVLVNCAR